MPTTWNAETDGILFRAIISCLPSITQLDTNQRQAIVSYMKENGCPDTTWEGIRYVLCLDLHLAVTWPSKDRPSLLLFQCWCSPKESTGYFLLNFLSSCIQPRSPASDLLPSYPRSTYQYYAQYRVHTLTMAPSRLLQNWNEDGLAWRVAIAFAEQVRKDDWAAVMDALQAQGCQFTESALRYVSSSDVQVHLGVLCPTFPSSSLMESPTPNPPSILSPRISRQTRHINALIRLAIETAVMANPKHSWDEPGVYRDIMLAMYDQFSPSLAELDQVVDKAKAMGGWTFTRGGL